MDAMSNKAIIIAVGVLVTIIITSGIIFTISQIQNIYKKVYETDISITQGFDEYDKYSNTVRTGIDMYNAASKYLDNPMVTVKEGNTKINIKSQVDRLRNNIGSISSVEYNTRVERKDDYITIIFNKK